MVTFQDGSIHDMSPLKWGVGYNKTGGVTVCPGPSLKWSVNIMQFGEQNLFWCPREIGERKDQHTYVWAMGSCHRPV